MKKKYLSPFEGEKLYTLVKTVIAGDARLKMRMVVDTRWNARPFVQTGQNGTGYWIMDPLEKEAYGFNVEWNGEFKSVAEIEAMLKPAMDVMQKWCDERDGLLDIEFGCTLYNHDVVKLPEARKVKALQTGRLCARFRYAKEYIDGLKKAQKKKKLHESGLLSGQAAYERMRQGEKPLVPSFVLKTNGGTILVPVDMTLDELIGWNDRLGKGDVSSIKVVSKTDPKKLKESASYLAGVDYNIGDTVEVKEQMTLKSGKVLKVGTLAKVLNVDTIQHRISFELFDEINEKLYRISADKLRFNFRKSSLNFTEELKKIELEDYNTSEFYSLKNPVRINCRHSGLPRLMYGIAIAHMNDEDSDYIYFTDEFDTRLSVRGHQVIGYHRPDISDVYIHDYMKAHGKINENRVKSVWKTGKLRESSIVLNVDDPADAAKIGGKQNAKAVIVKYDGKFHVNNRYDSVSGRLWLDERPFDTERAASDYRDYLNSHGDY